MDISIVNKRKINALVGVRMIRYNYLIPPPKDDEKTPFFERVVEMKREMLRSIVTLPLAKIFKELFPLKPDFEFLLELFDPVGQHVYLNEDCRAKMLAKS
jgi:hypothetical protein